MQIIRFIFYSNYILITVFLCCFLLYQKFNNCLRKLTIVDDTLNKLEITTDHQKLYTKVLLVILGWFLFVMWKMYSFGVWYSDRCGRIKAVYISFIFDYCSYLNLFDDLTIATILRLVYFLIKITLIMKLYLHAQKLSFHYTIRKF